MIVIAGLIGGAAWGAWLAKKRNGNRLDMLQYAAGYGILFGLLGVFITLFLARVL